MTEKVTQPEEQVQQMDNLLTMWIYAAGLFIMGLILSISPLGVDKIAKLMNEYVGPWAMVVGALGLFYASIRLTYIIYRKRQR